MVTDPPKKIHFSDRLGWPRIGSDGLGSLCRKRKDRETSAKRSKTADSSDLLRIAADNPKLKSGNLIGDYTRQTNAMAPPLGSARRHNVTRPVNIDDYRGPRRNIAP
jgi:hypothetical protein